MECEGLLKRGWGYGLMIEDDQGRKLGEIALDKRFLDDINNILVKSEKNARGKVRCLVSVAEDGISIKVMPKEVISSLPAGRNEQGDIMPIKLKKKAGRPVGWRKAKNNEQANADTTKEQGL